MNRVMTESESRRRFDALFAAYGPDIVAYCSWRAGSESDAQDAAAEVFLTAWRRLGAVPEGEAARVWLYATARRVVANQRRSRRRRAALQERLMSEAAAASSAESLDHEAALVREALRRLGARDREVLLLAEWEGLSPSEIGAVLGCLAVTARGRLHRAQRRFRAVFEDVRSEGRASREHHCLRRRDRNMPETLDALRRANPRAETGFDEAVEAVSRAVRAQLGTRAAPPSQRRSRRGLVRLSLALAACAAVAAAVVSLSSGPSGAPNAAAAVKKAATVSAASAERSGTAVVRLTHGGDLWAGTTIRWHGGDLSVSSDAPTRLGRAGSKLLVVGGTVYGVDPEYGGWLAMGSPRNIDPHSGTTPAEYLAAVREDVGGATLERITGAMTHPTTRQLADGSTVYSGAVKAGVVARETGFKGGQAIRVLPFGFVAHGAAAHPASPLDVSVTVGADGIVRGIAVTWRNWSYRVGYADLGSTPALAAPKNARSLEQLRRARAGR